MSEQTNILFHKRLLVKKNMVLFGAQISLCRLWELIPILWYSQCFTLINPYYFDELTPCDRFQKVLMRLMRLLFPQDSPGQHMSRTKASACAQNLYRVLDEYKFYHSWEQPVLQKGYKKKKKKKGGEKIEWNSCPSVAVRI